MNSYLRLDECCQIELSSIDKKSKPNEKSVKLCNFTDVYYNWNIYSSMIDGFMEATASDKNISSFLLKKGDVVVTKDSETRDDIGMAALVYEDLPNTVLGYHCALIRPKKNIDGAYLNAYLNSYLGRKHFRNQASGSGQRYTLTKESLGSIKIPVIPMTEQKKIGAFFSDIDKKIQNNIQTTTNLESLAKTIYDYWFLQFEFPNEDGKPYKSSGGKMVWNDELKREIPEGWEVFMVKDFCDIFTGKKDVNQALDTGKYKFFSCAPGYKYSNDKLYTGKAILISGNGSYTGRTIFVNDSFDLYQRTYACVMKPNYDNMLEYIFYTMKTFFVKRVSGGTHGSAIPYIVYNDIANEHFYYNKEVVDTFMKTIESIQEHIIELSKESQELASLRDFLLPLLMNGQVTFKEVG